MTFDEYQKSEHQSSVEEFMRLAKQELPKVPCVPSEEVCLLRAKLILEEAIETIYALGFTVAPKTTTNEFGVKFWDFDLGTHEDGPDIIEIADGCADLSVVTIGTLSACGIGDRDLLECVDRNNLAKFGPGHSIRADGKLVKPPGHQPPDIAGVLKSQGWEDASPPLPSV